MPTPNAQHHPRQWKERCRTIIAVLPTLLIGVVTCATGAAGVALGGHSTLPMASAAAADDTTPPRRPRYVRLAGATSTSVTLAWRRPYDDVGVTGYNVNAGGPTFRTTETTYTITSLACATTYGSLSRRTTRPATSRARPG